MLNAEATSILESVSRLKASDYGFSQYVGKRKGLYKQAFSTFSIHAETITEDASVIRSFAWYIPFCGTITGTSFKDIKKALFSMNKALAGDNLVVYVHNLSYAYTFMSEIARKVFIARGEVLSFEYGGCKFRDSKALVLESEKDFLEHMGKVDLHGALSAYFDSVGYDGVHCPLTASAIVRGMIEEERQRDRVIYPRIQNYETYLDMCEALHGAIIIRPRIDELFEDVHCYDIKSSYPYLIFTQEFPLEMRKTKRTIEEEKEDGNAVIAQIHITSLHPKNIDHLNIIGEEEGASIWATDIDIDMLRSEYEIDFDVIKAYSGRKGKLPKPIRDITQAMFIAKEMSPKGSPEKLVNKIRVNSIAGAMQIKSRDFNTGEVTEQAFIRDKMRKNTFPIFWGVYLLAMGRKAMQEAVEESRREGLFSIYGDTDSLWVVGGELDLDTVNGKKNRALKCGEKIAGLFELDKHADRMLITSMKHYAYEDKGKLVVKVAGGNGNIPEILEREGLEAFKTGLQYEVEKCVQITTDGHRTINGEDITPCCAVIRNEKRTLGGLIDAH